MQERRQRNSRHARGRLNGRLESDLTRTGGFASLFAQLALGAEPVFFGRSVRLAPLEPVGVSKNSNIFMRRLREDRVFDVIFNGDVRFRLLRDFPVSSLF